MNKPVAWMAYTYMKDNLVGNVKVPQLHLTQPPPSHYDEIIPLYTHPVKELTDEEIDNMLVESFNRGKAFGYAEGLRKEQDK